MKTPASTPMPGSKQKDYVVVCSHVLVDDGEWVPVDLTEFIDISEDFQGYDVMFFKYKGKEYKSRVQNRPRC